MGRLSSLRDSVRMEREVGPAQGSGDFLKVGREGHKGS